MFLPDPLYSAASVAPRSSTLSAGSSESARLTFLPLTRPEWLPTPPWAEAARNLNSFPAIIARPEPDPINHPVAKTPTAIHPHTAILSGRFSNFVFTAALRACPLQNASTPPACGRDVAQHSRSHLMLPPRTPCGRSRQSPAVLTRSRPPNAETQLVSATLPQPRFIRGAPHLSDPACISILVVSLLLAPAFRLPGPLHRRDPRCGSRSRGRLRLRRRIDQEHVPASPAPARTPSMTARTPGRWSPRHRLRTPSPRF